MNYVALVWGEPEGGPGGRGVTGGPRAVSGYRISGPGNAIAYNMSPNPPRTPGRGGAGGEAPVGLVRIARSAPANKLHMYLRICAEAFRARGGGGVLQRCEPLVDVRVGEEEHVLVSKGGRGEGGAGGGGPGWIMRRRRRGGVNGAGCLAPEDKVRLRNRRRSREFILNREEELQRSSA